MAVEAFGIEKEFLHSLLDEAAEAKAQLPEFQRGWVWPVENIRSLLASISLGYPVGTVMMLRTGGEVRFKQRPIEGVTATGNAERLILDGQQRLTSPAQVGQAPGRELDREDVVFVPADKGRGAVDEVQRSRRHLDEDLRRRMVPAAGTTPTAGPARRHAVRQLSGPDLALGSEPRILAARTAAVCGWCGRCCSCDVRRASACAWEERRKSWSGQQYRVLHEVANTDFLQAITLLHTDRLARHTSPAILMTIGLHE